MDRIFESREAQAYESWLESRPGRQYAFATCSLLSRILDCRKGWRVLDVGCGLGVHLSHLMERGLLASGLDASPVAARLASTRLGEKADIKVGDAHDLPFEDNSFDAVILVNTLEFTDRRAQVVAEAARVAASRVCIISMNTLSPLSWYLKRYNSPHPMADAATLGLWSLWRLVREVLGPVPTTWAGSPSWLTLRNTGPWPWALHMGVCAAVTPRFMTTPLVLNTGHMGSNRPAASPGGLSIVPRIKNTNNQRR